MKTTQSLDFAKLPRTYDGLVRELGAPRRIHDKVDFENATEIVEAMAGHRLTRDQEDYLDLISDLVDQYDRAASATVMRRSTPAEILRALLDEHGMTASSLGELLGDRALGSRLLRGERELSKTHIRILSGHFKIAPALLL
jgi:HTH-type transcriptional regulator/antitoxin HigA